MSPEADPRAGCYECGSEPTAWSRYEDAGWRPVCDTHAVARHHWGHEVRSVCPETPLTPLDSPTVPPAAEDRPPALPAATGYCERHNINHGRLAVAGCPACREEKRIEAERVHHQTRDRRKEPW